MGVGEVLRDQQEEAPESVEGRTYREVKKFGGGGIFPYRGISPSPHTNGSPMDPGWTCRRQNFVIAKEISEFQLHYLEYTE